MSSFNRINKVFAVVSIYWFISISLVFINKWLLSDNRYTCIISFSICYAMSDLAIYLPNYINFPQITFSHQTAIQVLPLSIIFVLMVCFNNFCLKYVYVSFYFLARSLTTIFNVIFTYFILNTHTTRRAIACCTIIVIGYGSGALIEGNIGGISFTGIFLGIGSSIFCALNSIYTAKCLPLVNGSVWQLTFYNNVNAFFLLIPVIAFFELYDVFNMFFTLNVLSWIVLSISGLFGFGIGYVSSLQIQITSPLTHNVSGTAKAAAQTVLAVLIYHDVKSVTWWLANATVMFGSALYAWVRHNEGMKKDPIDKDSDNSSFTKSNVVIGSEKV